jgi:predicted  nucleic acid-binding Zn-ribbon protein
MLNKDNCLVPIRNTRRNNKVKKIMVILLTLSLIAGTSTVAFAEGNSTTDTTETTTSPKSVNLTPEEQQARDAYLKVHFDDMNQLVTLRKQTQEAQDANNAAAKQIQEKLKAKTALNNDSVAKLKDLASERKALIAQAKKLHEQRLSLREQYKAAVKAKDVDKMKSIQQQILDLNKQVTDLKAKEDAIKTQITPLKEGLKAMKDANKQLKDNVKNQLQGAKTMHESIKTQEQEKTQLWNNYKENIKNKDYVAAGTTFKAIIDKKSAILNNITQRGTILNAVLASLN